ncbi:RTM1-like protein [Fusarium heterosporum]|uniref:RTM1-like protein n=1 Tax=Fusarium heterosporum TaxID=42747 RepID=A0A8H5TFI3_FUSHE|nr:RTM1-like protein [Fusarium heterosporum]
MTADGIKLDIEIQDKLSTTEDTVVAGLIVELFFFSMFVVVTGWFHLNFSKHSTTQPTHWQNFITVIYTASVLILIRSVFRMAEYCQGPGAELQSKEVYIYALDAIPMAMISIGFHVFHPSKYMLGLEKTLSTADSEVSFNFPASEVEKCCEHAEGK